MACGTALPPDSAMARQHEHASTSRRTAPLCAALTNAEERSLGWEKLRTSPGTSVHASCSLTEVCQNWATIGQLRPHLVRCWPILVRETSAGQIWRPNVASGRVWTEFELRCPGGCQPQNWPTLGRHWAQSGKFGGIRSAGMWNSPENCAHCGMKEGNKHEISETLWNEVCKNACPAWPGL